MIALIEDLPEVDHIVPTSLGGKDGYDNWQLLHRHCHDTKTAGQRLPARQG
jgi:RNA-directed DNA polymerase